MLEFVQDFFTSGSFIPHGHCYLWQPNLVGLHVVSDGLIGIAYYSIPFILFYFVRHRSDLPFDWMFLLFGSFIIACGTTHLLEIWTLWHPIYWLSGAVKASTALVSLYTAGALVPLVPKALSLPSPVQLEVANRELQREIAERKEIEKTLRESEARYRAIVEDQTEMICRFRSDGTFTFVNQAYCRYFGRTPEELIGHSFVPVIFPDDLDHVEQQLDTLGPENPVTTITNRVMRPDGEIRTHQWTNRAILDQQDHFVEFQAVGRDITELQQTRQIQAALKEKEVLLKEIHHRVKNNLQIIYSLLRLQSRQIKDQQMAQFLLDSQNRVKSIALIHEKLYRSEDLAKINLKQYIPSLVSNLFSSYKINSDVVTLETKIEDISLDIDTAIPCGLIINELISNSLKHAFPEGRGGKIHVRLHGKKKGLIRLIVGDSGIGIPDKIDPARVKSLGLSLVRDLASQLKGTVRIHRHQGTLFVVTFPERSEP
ncbi:PAS domain S-box protein [Kovacikia minuta CCNUW1]|uniref:sensor histidine kinase n=1 Tax=Kovacikia minuta TaxID=2931930 RepID=UPI001CCE707E|nr:histidine kinase dimerization/phosphoacceptor domain -containing protein [Kovacikia minuta]UBF27353.1 PAS domain S-box protein [Kovacikia minuta CCNUW1]